MDPDASQPTPKPDPAPQLVRTPLQSATVDKRSVFIASLAIGLGAAAMAIAIVLQKLIALITNLSFYGRFSFENVTPWQHQLGAWVVFVPIVGAVVVGLMARYGSKAIRGHGIPEAMEQILVNESKIPARITVLKPLSAAVSIGTGGPFGAEGPIIATGGALGSLVGQVISVTADERKTLLAAGAAAGMTAIFGTPVSAVLLAVELLLFEYRSRSMIPVALACVTSIALRLAIEGGDPVFPMPPVHDASGWAMATYGVFGLLFGVVAVAVTKAVYAVEDGFERLPIHWMWWPALGAVVVGVVGLFVPRTLGVGYQNIVDIIGGNLPARVLALLCVAKLVSWLFSLGSGTSGGTLAPLFTIGGALGGLLGSAVAQAFPGLGVDPRVAALLGMAAIFGGAARALLTSAVFAFETTRQPAVLMPLLASCTAAYLVSALMMRNTIMTEKIVRRGTRVLSDYAVDFLDSVHVKECCTRDVLELRADDTLADVRTWLASGAPGTRHQGFPVVSAEGKLLGIVTAHDLRNPSRPGDMRVRDAVGRMPVVCFEDNSLREAADHMVAENVGRLPVVQRADPTKVVGILTRSDLLQAHKRRITEAREPRQHIVVPFPGRRAET